MRFRTIISSIKFAREIIIALAVNAGSAHGFTLASTDSLEQGWAARPLVVRINHTNCPTNIDNWINQAFNLWNSVPGSALQITLGAESTNTSAELKAGTATDVPLIVCDPDFGTTLSLDANLIPGAGFVSGSMRPIQYGGLFLNVQTGSDADMNTLSDLVNTIVVAHEIGHVFGLGHSSDSASLMYYSLAGKTHLALSQDDMDGINYLYSRNELTNLKLIGGCGAISSSQPPDSWYGGNSLGLLFALYFAVLLWRRSAHRFAPI